MCLVYSIDVTGTIAGPELLKRGEWVLVKLVPLSRNHWPCSKWRLLLPGIFNDKCLSLQLEVAVLILISPCILYVFENCSKHQLYALRVWALLQATLRKRRLCVVLHHNNGWPNVRPKRVGLVIFISANNWRFEQFLSGICWLRTV
jgi:hypothetical protein